MLKKSLRILFSPLIILLYFIPEILFSKAFFIDDIYGQQVPWRYYLRHYLLRLKIPLWTDRIFYGHPFFASGQTSSLFVLNLPFYFIKNPFTSYTFNLIFLYLLAGLGLYLVCMKYDLSRTGAFISSLLFVFSGQLVSHSRHLNMIATIALAPYVILLVKAASESHLAKKTIAFIFGASVLVAWQVFAFHPPVFLMQALIIILFFAVESVVERRWSGMVIAILVFLTGAVIAMPQLIASYRLSLYTKGIGGSGYKWMSSFSPNIITDLPLFMFPFPMGSDNFIGVMSKSIYFTFTGTLLFVFALFRVRNRKMLPFLVAALVSIFLLFPQINVLYRLLSKLPVLSKMRAMGRWWFPGALFASVIAGYGYDEFKKSPGGIFKALYYLVLVIFAYYLLLFLILRGNFWKFGVFDFKEPTNIIGILVILLFLLGSLKKRLFAPLLIGLLVLETFSFRISGIPSVNLSEIKVPAFYSRLSNNEPRRRVFVAMADSVFSKYETGQKSRIFPRVFMGDIHFLTSVKRAFGYDSPYFTPEFMLKKIAEWDSLLCVQGDRSDSMLLHELSKYGVNFLITPHYLPLHIAKPYYISSAFNIYEIDKRQCLFDVLSGDVSDYSILKHNESEKNMEIDAKTPAKIGFFMRYFPGWKCFVNGREEEINNTGYLITCAIASGKNKIRLVYKPFYKKLIPASLILQAVLISLVILLLL